MTAPIRSANPAGRPGTALPLTFIGIAFFSAKEAHRFLILDILRTIHGLDDFPQSANSALAKRNMPDNFLWVALRRIPITPDLNPNLVVRHRTSFRPYGAVSSATSAPPS